MGNVLQKKARQRAANADEPENEDGGEILYVKRVYIAAIFIGSRDEFSRRPSRAPSLFQPGKRLRHPPLHQGHLPKAENHGVKVRPQWRSLSKDVARQLDAQVFPSYVKGAVGVLVPVDPQHDPVRQNDVPCGGLLQPGHRLGEGGGEANSRSIEVHANGVVDAVLPPGADKVQPVAGVLLHQEVPRVGAGQKANVLHRVHGKFKLRHGEDGVEGAGVGGAEGEGAEDPDADYQAHGAVFLLLVEESGYTKMNQKN